MAEQDVSSAASGRCCFERERANVFSTEEFILDERKDEEERSLQRSLRRTSRRIIIGDPVPSAPRIASGEGGDESELFDKDKIDSGLPSEIEACYALMNAQLHKIYRPIHGEYDDYITKPKKSGYKSLHTAVVGGDGKPLEVQIRTREDMHDAAEWGVAAHWLYKARNGEQIFETFLEKKKNEVDEREKDPASTWTGCSINFTEASRAGRWRCRRC